MRVRERKRERGGEGKTNETSLLREKMFPACPITKHSRSKATIYENIAIIISKNTRNVKNNRDDPETRHQYESIET